jgi:tRNA dimethylallyltransferase
MILVLGVTASGKSRLGFDLANSLDTQIISIDSMKVYRRMDIGTAKPPLERRKQVKYHLIDVVEPSEAFSVDQFLDMTNSAIDQISGSGKPVIAIGGTAMYIKALLYGLFEGPGSDEAIREKLKQQIDQEGSGQLHKNLCTVDPEAGIRIHPNDHRRIIRALEVYELTGKPISSFQQQFNAEKMLRDWTIVGLRREKDTESSRINQRVKKMVDLGLLDEVKSLLTEDKPLSKQAAAAIGYAEMIEHLQGDISYEKAVENIKVNTRRLAKSQRTWFKTFKDVDWLDIEEDESPESIHQRTLKIVNDRR